MALVKSRAKAAAANRYEKVNLKIPERLRSRLMEYKESRESELGVFIAMRTCILEVLDAYLSASERKKPKIISANG